ncbi:MAG: SDR family NAD(P)-dependent oxidoreductase [Sandaracinaceae bacterium]|nr:SDR family NAD(P)-dependent oxidoreductase [Sandaracinaceae bacterium]
MTEKIILLGGTSGIGRAIARIYAVRGASIALLGRNPLELSRSVADLEIRGAGKVIASRCDLGDPTSFDRALDEAFEALVRVDHVIVTAAAFGTQEELERDRVQLERLLDLNFTKTILFIEAVKERLLSQGGGTLCVLSSVAGERGRKPVAFYGAAKAGLSHYLESLDHQHGLSGLRVITVKPGFVKTSMTAELKPPPFAGEPDEVAWDIVRGIDKGQPVIFTPWPWRYVMAIIRRLPRSIMRRVDF